MRGHVSTSLPSQPHTEEHDLSYEHIPATRQCVLCFHINSCARLWPAAEMGELSWRIHRVSLHPPPCMPAHSPAWAAPAPIAILLLPAPNHVKRRRGEIRKGENICRNTKPSSLSLPSSGTTLQRCPADAPASSTQNPTAEEKEPCSRAACHHTAPNC